MNGAHALLSTLVASGVDTCFTNPGTSEMHFVAALDDVPEMRAILTLFEGVATGAADGYARMADRPGATLLHLGPGLGNGLANLHNARRARTPIVNIVGDHAISHQPLDAPLASDIEIGRAQRVGLDPVVGLGGRGRAGCERRDRRGDGRMRCDVDLAGRRVVVGGCGARTDRGSVGRAAAARRRHRARGQGVAFGRAGRAVPRRGRGARARAGRRATDCGCNRRQAVVRDVPRASRARRGASRGRAPRVPRRVRGRPARRLAAPRVVRRAAHRCRSSRIPASPGISFPTVRSARADSRGLRCRSQRSRRSPTRSTRPRRRAAPAAAAARTTHGCADRGVARRARSARCCPRVRS